jgi:hypothetical protein
MFWDFLSSGMLGYQGLFLDDYVLGQQADVAVRVSCGKTKM